MRSWYDNILYHSNVSAEVMITVDLNIIFNIN